MFFFNWEYYIYKYKDLTDSNINNNIKALDHWVKYGKKEERLYVDVPIHFNWQFYLLNNIDLIESGISNEEDAWRHYIYHGYIEKRYPSIENLVKIYCIRH
jgi:hypothetical protein